MPQKKISDLTPKGFNDTKSGDLFEITTLDNNGTRVTMSLNLQELAKAVYQKMRVDSTDPNDNYTIQKKIIEAKNYNEFEYIYLMDPTGKQYKVYVDTDGNLRVYGKDVGDLQTIMHEYLPFMNTPFDIDQNPLHDYTYVGNNSRSETEARANVLGYGQQVVQYADITRNPNPQMEEWNRLVNNFERAYFPARFNTYPDGANAGYYDPEYKDCELKVQNLKDSFYGDEYYSQGEPKIYNILDETIVDPTEVTKIDFSAPYHNTYLFGENISNSGYIIKFYNNADSS